MPTSRTTRETRGRARRERWESVAADTDRLAVPGGWIYRSVKRGAGVATCFVPAAGDSQQAAALRRTAGELKEKLEQLRKLLGQLAAARKLRNAPLRSTKVH